jgi:hypothetical protein
MRSQIGIPYQPALQGSQRQGGRALDDRGMGDRNMSTPMGGMRLLGMARDWKGTWVRGCEKGWGVPPPG